MKWLFAPCLLFAALPVFAQTGFTITTSSFLPSGMVQVPYNLTFTSSGGAGAVTWSAGGGLPPGMGVSPGGVLSGTPAQSGFFNFTVSAVDQRGNSTSKSFSLTIQEPPLAISSVSPLPAGVVGVPYSFTFVAVNGIKPYGFSGSGLPPGLNLSQSGVLSGTPASAGQFTLSVTVIDCLQCSNGASVDGSEGRSAQASKQFSLTINPAATTPPPTGGTAGNLAITSSSPLPAGAVNSPYTFTFEATGGLKPYTFSATSTPPGLTLAANGVLSGTPTAPGQFTVSVGVSDSGQGSARLSATQSFSLRIALGLTVTTPTPIAATLGSPLTVVMTSVGGVPRYLWFPVSGSALPPGFTLDAGSGFLGGTPTAVGTFKFSVQVQDGGGSVATAELTMNVAPALSVTTASPPPAGAGVDYSLPLAATGGNPPFTWAVDSGVLPPGLSLHPSTGLLSGTPLSPGGFNFVIRVTDSARASVTKAFSLTVAAAPAVLVSTLSLDFVALAGGDPPAPQSVALVTPSGQPLQFTVRTDGGAGLPAPLWLLARLLKGTLPGRIPVAVDQGDLPAGTYTARVVVTTSDGRQTVINVTLTLTDAPALLEVGPDSLRFAGPASLLSPASQTLLIRNAGGSGGLEFQINVVGDAPWLTVSPATGQAGANAPAAVRVAVNAAAVPRGARRALIHITSGGGNADIPVSLLSQEDGPVIGFNVSGLRFEAPAGSRASTRSKSAGILNLGTGTLSYRAEIVSGADWLSLANPTGSATPALPGTFSLTAAAGALKPGNYYASIKVTDPGALNSPQLFPVMLAVTEENTPPEPDPSPSGLFFVGKTGGAALPVQIARLFTGSAAPIPFQVSANTGDGINWLAVAPSTGMTSAANVAQVNVTATPGQLAPGVYTGEVTVAFSTTSIRSINVTLVVAPAAADLPKAPSAAGCTPARLALTQTGLVNNFSAPAGWPTPIVLRLTDDCGEPVPNGQIVLTFSNGDPAQLMAPSDPAIGAYAATWVPAKAGPSVSVTAQATSANLTRAVTQL
ncbi:MAG TPA: putative Ig domain-containing protein, partial [Bryobacteraceae bacterium]|nr:putative Ig domain-containing protein [Bryobacteraceae bacterium]